MADVSSPGSWDQLPLYILELISEQLADSGLLSIFSFSLASRVCALATRQQRFARINFRLTGDSRLCSYVDRCRTILDPCGYGRYVRRVKVIGGIPIGVPGTDSARGDYYRREVITGHIHMPWHDHARPEQEARSSMDDRFSFDRSEIPVLIISQRRRLDEDLRKRQDKAGQPLADLIKDLPSLVDLIYESNDVFPRCLLKALQERPNIRLHMHSFCLDTFIDLSDLDAHQLALITTPSLYSLVVYSKDFSPAADDHREAALQMITRLAPRLRHVAIRYGWKAFLDKNTIGTLPSAWLGFPDDNPVGRLSSLTLQEAAVNERALAKWSRQTDFTVLRELELIGYLSVPLLQALTRMAQDGQFRSLRMLALGSDLPISLARSGEKAASLFMEALNPLESLKLVNFIGDDIFRTVIHRHGNTLRQLCLDNSAEDVSIHHIEELQAHCLRLRDLKFPVLRTLGDKEEVAFYRALGNLRLQRLTLWLQVIPSDGTEDLRPSDPGYISIYSKKMLVNSAIDAKLARSIFRLISTAQSRDGHPSTLNYLRITPRGQEDVFTRGVPDSRIVSWQCLLWVVQYIARTWICERDQWGKNRVSVRKVPDFNVDNASSLMPLLYRECVDPWRALWGLVGEWEHNWKSFPLDEC
ncbi:protein kinase subdomain-containing protein [Ophiocordyceps sinensis CO18]|uniref:Protein kinase subdomain-containing protein n=1 Tax=Ophiocordyceps sinensis (strain Co18 / CGMCC 3.14243) TaxID=911162 RepID=T5ALR8_OPHSC|nr:protein kinase subdomain-containing protein [Ophiocordyceps sinensis CO18]